MRIPAQSELSAIQKALRNFLLRGRISRSVFEWDSIKDACDSRMMRASYIFLTVIPLATKALLPIQGTIAVPFLNRELQVAIALPFTWWLLFIAACFGSLAGIVYAIRCPSLIKRFPDFPTYEGSKRGTRMLARTVDEIVGRVAKGYVVPYAKAKDSLMAKQMDEITAGEPFSGVVVGGRNAQLMVFREYVPWSEDTVGVDIAMSEGRVTPELFYFVHDGAKRSRPFSRALATGAIYCAYGCFAFIALQSALTVINYVLRG